ncbi:unnamed protein product [Paramecium octaurelia]|uniref:Uncharacterized protein n=1 Tax=Paramecium octaurelia TaxID=43137 RepID=A0A8S1UD71_PAROT|nr:unnamed protein product [Paramecium octaurelia]CAD8162804.1 unnamed protein product [Paramecium octaurelia]
MPPSLLLNDSVLIFSNFPLKIRIALFTTIIRPFNLQEGFATTQTEISINGERQNIEGGETNPKPI